jgi:hypothetical protein
VCNAPSIFQIYTGFRYDTLKTHNNIEDECGNRISSNHLKEKNLSIWELGLQGRFSYCSWFVRGFGSYGWIGTGQYRDRHSPVDDDAVLTKAKIRHGRTVDGLVGLGYLFPYNTQWNLGPVIGWGYDSQRIRAYHARTDGFSDRILDGLHYKTIWSGPWIGIDTTYDTCDYLLQAGYEFHWAHWHASWNPGCREDFDTISDSRNSNRVYGNVLYADMIWKSCSGWGLGIGLRLQQWRANRGSIKANDNKRCFVETDRCCEEEFDRIKRVDWYSAAIRLNLGYVF